MTGHVFVVNASLENLHLDAVVIPTDLSFSVTSQWDVLLGFDGVPRRSADRSGGHERPTMWREQRWGRAPARATGRQTAVWYLDAAAYLVTSLEASLGAVMKRLALVLADIACAQIEPAQGRARPLVAVPVIGIGRGGFGAIRGAVIEALLTECEKAVGSTGVDVVIVAKDPSVYAALQAHRRARGSVPPALGASREMSARRIASQARSGELVLFVGAGVGMGAGLPSWAGLLRALGTASGIPETELSGLDSDLDRAELLSRAAGPDFGQQVARIISETTRYSVAHALLAALGCAEVVTTNYDTLYEKAASDVGHGRAVATLPYEQARAGTPWVLKMHGDVDHPEDIVLTRRDFVRYDALSKPLGAIVQSLMATKHLLVIGTSMTDDNFLRLAHEVLEFRAKGDAARGAGPETIGTVVSLTDVPVKAKLWEGRFDYLAVSESESLAAQVRDLSIFLDCVAMHASDSSHLLDERFDHLLPDAGEKAVATAARELLALVEELPDSGGERWVDVVRALEVHGARSGRESHTSL